jgi:hypothetical protein
MLFIWVLSMTDFRLYDMTWQAFENLVVTMCRDLLGEGVTCFSAGRDKGRDAWFEGTANRFPSEKSPVKGKVNIQAKHTTSPVENTTGGPFEAILRDEIPKLRTLKAENGLDAILFFTNRKQSSSANMKQIKNLRTETGVQGVWIWGRESIEKYLATNQKIVKELKLDQLRCPLCIHPEDLAKVILEFRSGVSLVDMAFDSIHNFPAYGGILKKNKVNHLSKEFFDHINKSSAPYFAEIKSFLENPRNAQLREYYHNTADEFQSKTIAHRSEFDTFDRVLVALYDLVLESHPELTESRQLISVFIHYMYCNCDLGSASR